jgi:hypothetical protein
VIVIPENCDRHILWLKLTEQGSRLVRKSVDLIREEVAYDSNEVWVLLVNHSNDAVKTFQVELLADMGIRNACNPVTVEGRI